MLKKMMDSPEFNAPNFDPESLKKATQRLDPSIAFAPMDEVDELMEMQPEGLSLADVWMIRAAGITKEELHLILSQGFKISKGPPPAELRPGLLTDHDIQLIEETGFDVQPIRKLMTLGYSVVFVDEPEPLPKYDEPQVVMESKPTTVDGELNKLDKLGFDTQSLKELLDNGFVMIPAQEGSKIDMSLPLEPGLADQLTRDGFTLSGLKPLTGSALPDIGPPSASAQKQVAELPSTNLASLTAQAERFMLTLPKGVSDVFPGVGADPPKGVFTGAKAEPRAIHRERTRQPTRARALGKGETRYQSQPAQPMTGYVIVSEELSYHR